MTLSAGPEAVEIKRLETTVARIEQNLAGVTVNSDVANALATYLSSLRLRIESLTEKQITIEEQKQRVVDQQHVAVLVARETALNEREKEQYAGFLQQEYFTKANFDELEQFYSNTYDRLSEEGKAQMSHRVWEGVRQQQYQFSELPDPVKEKEAQSLRDMFSGVKHMPKEINQIPSNDRSDFINAWDAGQKSAAYSVLDRSSFADHVAVSTRKVEESVAVESPTLDTKAVKTTEKDNTRSDEVAEMTGDLDLSKLNVQLASADATGVAPPRMNEPKKPAVVTSRSQ